MSTRETYIGEYSYRLVKTGGADTRPLGNLYHLCRDEWADIHRIGLAQSERHDGRAETGARADRYQRDDGQHLCHSRDDGTSGGWVRVSVTTTATATGNARLYVWLDDVTTGTVYISAVQATQSAFAHPYTAGTRTATSMSYPGLSVAWNRLTIMAWIYPAAAASEVGTTLRVLILNKDASNFYNLHYGTTNLLTLSNAGGTIVTSTRRYLATPGRMSPIRLAAARRRFISTAWRWGQGPSVRRHPGVGPTLYVGSSDVLANHLNGLVDDLVVVDRTCPPKKS